MPSTYSSNLKIELMSTGENSGTWGDVTNTNLGTALEQAVVGYGTVDYIADANLTISITNNNASQAARALVLNVTSAFGSLTATRELVVPTIQKQYIVQNNTTGSQSILVKTSAGTGITVPNGRKAHLYVDGTNVVQMFDFVDINGGTIDGTPIGGSAAAAGAFTTLGATGAATFNGAVTLGDAAADLIVFNGTVNSHLLFTDNTFDIGANGATRPRNLFLAGAATIGGNLSVGGTLTLTGGLILNGNVTVGDSSADTLTVNATITSNLLFTDNTYDIGASGATRPRNLFIAGNITAGGNQTLTGALTVDSTTDSSSTTTGSIQTDGGLGVAKAAYIGTNLNVAGNTTLGDASGDTLTINGTAVSIPNGLNFDSNTLVIDAANNLVGVNRGVPVYPLDVNGIIRAAFPNPDVSGIILQATTVTNAAAHQVINGAGNLYLGLDTSTGNRLLGLGSTGGYQGVLNVESNYPLVLAQNNIARFYLLSSAAVFNERGDDYDFRVESDTNTHMLFVDASTNRVGIAQSSPGYELHVGAQQASGGTAGTIDRFAIQPYSNTGGPYIFKARTVSGASDFLDLYYGSSQIASFGLNQRVGINVDTPLAQLQVYVGTSNSTALQLSGLSGYTAGIGPRLVFQNGRGALDEQLAGIQGSFDVDSNGNYGRLSFFTRTTDALGIEEKMRIGYRGDITTFPITNGGAVFNETGVDADFRVESDNNTHMFFLDAGLNHVNIATASDLGGIFNISGTNSGIAFSYGSTVPNNPLHTAFYANNSGIGMDSTTAGIRLAGDTASQLLLDVGWYSGGSVSHANWLSSFTVNQNTVVVNEGSRDVDFRVESDNNTHALFVDAGNSRVGINNSSPTKTLSVTGVPIITNSGFAFLTVDRAFTSGVADFTFDELNGDVGDNFAYLVIVSVYDPSSATTDEHAGYVGFRITPRGGGGTLTQIVKTQAGNITTFTVAANGDGMRVTTDTTPALRCRVIVLGGGGITTPSE